jgi:hypothetical protein
VIQAAAPALIARRHGPVAQSFPQADAAKAPVTAPTDKGMTLVCTNQTKKIEIMKRDRKMGFSGLKVGGVAVFPMDGSDEQKYSPPVQSTSEPSGAFLI